MRGGERPRREERAGRPVKPVAPSRRQLERHRLLPLISSYTSFFFLCSAPDDLSDLSTPFPPSPLHLYSFLYLELSFREASIQLKSQSQIGMFCQGDVHRSKMTNTV